MTPGLGSPVCPTTCSTVKVFNFAAALTYVISTGGSFRADELCFVPPGTYTGPFGTIVVPHGIVQIANDLNLPPFITWIATDGPNAYGVIGSFQMSTQNGINATNGIEQCQFDPRTGIIYLNIPEVSGDGTDAFPRCSCPNRSRLHASVAVRGDIYRHYPVRRPARHGSRAGSLRH